jgi:hypothetical protein
VPSPDGSRRKDKDRIRLALHYAYEERSYFLSCLGDTDEEVKKRTKQLMWEWQDLLQRHYGEVPMTVSAHEAVSQGATISAFSLMNAKPRNFGDPT